MIDLKNKKIKIVKNNLNGKKSIDENLKERIKKNKIRIVLSFGVISLLSSSLKLEAVSNQLVSMNYKNEIDNENQKENVEFYIQKYCKIYNLDYLKIYNKAFELTNGFKNIESNGFFNIPGTRLGKKERLYDNIQIAILCFIRHCKQIPENFGFTKEEIEGYNEENVCIEKINTVLENAGVQNLFNKTYSKTEIAGIENLINNNSSKNEPVTCEEKVEYYCDLLNNVEKELCMAIIYSESGTTLNGNLYQVNNNPGSLCNNGVFRSFENLEQGIIELALYLYAYLEDNNSKDKSIDKLVKEIQLIYAPLEDDRNKNLKINENWVKNVLNNYYKLKNNYYSVYYERISEPKKQK